MGRDAVDVPAAHSMDTAWFAVDEEGKVGVFETGEDGALPDDAAWGSGAADANFDEDLLYGAIAAWMHARGALEEGGALVEGARPVILVDDPDPWREWISDGTLVQLRREAPAALMPAKRLSAKQARQLDALPRRALLDIDPVLDMRWDDEPSADFGLFAFASDDYGNPGAYVRVGAPQAALRLSELPEVLREAIGRLRLDLRFEAAEALHLADHPEVGPCQTWGETDLRGEPIPGGRSDPGGGPSGAPGLPWAWILLGVGALLLLLLALL